MLFMFLSLRIINGTSNLEQRMTQHFSGNGAQWTKLHKPISIKETRLLLPDENPLVEERIVTKQYMEEYGFDNVRGSVWCKVEYEIEPDWNKLKLHKPGNKRALNLNIEEELFDKLTQYRKLKGVTATSVIEELISNLHLNVDEDVDDKDNAVISEPERKPTDYMTEERFDYRVEPFTKLIPTLVSRVEQLSIITTRH